MNEYNKLLELSNIEGVEIYLDTKWLLNNTLGNNLNSADLLIRLLAIDEYFGKNDYGFKLYKKMQQTRLSKNKKIPPREDDEIQFKKLIKSFEINGYDNNMPVELNKDFKVFDGSHRLACAVAFEIPKIPIRFSKKYINENYDYSIKWFNDNGLKDFEKYIIQKYNELVKKGIVILEK